MGVPKFFRYISERYPCLSEVVREYQIPEFDNMYLDMNGIIHMCSHPDDNNIHFRITEERIFKDIFHYIEVLFRMIKPRKLFFMAIDGVAPRAKMNQQRGRRFRTAKETQKQEAEARKRGEVLPEEEHFDSNCITPGTAFMSRLHEQLKYFCVNKISNDILWKDVKVILSGHETPGEGEHKIMDYIRYLRAQPDYDPTTRHCLYGLDADLIMLGLCTHEPHFSLLREEVRFGKKSNRKQTVPEQITFFLLHLSLLREYLELEFMPVKNELVGFKYDFEKIIDDWVLMGFLVGNDFIPHLPHLHIANGALPILYKAYMDVLPTLDGYINESGVLNLERFEKFMKKLSEFDIANFEEVRDDFAYMEAKTGRKYNPYAKSPVDQETSEIEQEVGANNQCLTDPELLTLIQATDRLDVSSDEDDDSEEHKAFTDFKKEYYKNKLEYSNVTREVLQEQAEGYVRAIQWNLHYYYNGCCSWSWYYPHHYAPYISDITGFKDLKLEFDLGTPFKPYEQLLAVLPTASIKLLPTAYHQLMTNPDSPIVHYYPEDFQTDKNGKRQEWEAVVLIPFMDENLLLKAMKPCNEKLSPDEIRRNTHGPMLVCTYSDKKLQNYEAPAFFPAINENHCNIEFLSTEDIRVSQDKLVKGLYPGVKLDVYYPGFPTLRHLKYTAELKMAKVKVFEQASRFESMIIKIEENGPKAGELPLDLLGTNVFVGWPHMIEARIVGISNSKKKFTKVGNFDEIKEEEITDKSIFRNQSAHVITRYTQRMGIDLGQVDVLCHAQVMTGKKCTFTPNGKVTLEKQFSGGTANYPLQTIVSNIESYDSYHTLFREASELFPKGSRCFSLSHPGYGSEGIVTNSSEVTNSGKIEVLLSTCKEPDFSEVYKLNVELFNGYRELVCEARRLAIPPVLYSRITGTIYVDIPDKEGKEGKKVNIGLDLKWNKKNMETPGYTKKINGTWCYSDKCTALIKEYINCFSEVFSYLTEHRSNNDIAAEDIFGVDCEKTLPALLIWLKSLPISTIERRTCGSQEAEPEVVREIERTVDKYMKELQFSCVRMHIKPSLLYKPELQSGTLPPDPKVDVAIFDRIINTRKGYSVPYGLKGTIIAIKPAATDNDRDTMYDVVFDKEFEDGLELNCSPGRGYRLPITSFINISYGQRTLEKKLGSANDAQLSVFTKEVIEGAKSSNSTSSSSSVWSNILCKNSKVSKQQGSAFALVTYNKPDLLSQEVGTSDNHDDLNISSRRNYKVPKISTCKPQRCGYDVPHREQPNLSLQKVKSNNDKSKKNLFMPSFMDHEESGTKEVVKKIQVKSRNSDPENSDSVSKMSSSMRPSETNASVATFITKIDDSQTKREQAVGKSSAPLVLNKNENGSLTLFELLAQVANQPPSKRLLTYYKSNGLGRPQYQYEQTGKKFIAKIRLINGNVVSGQPANTTNEAAERAAATVLDFLLSKTPPTAALRGSNENIPALSKTLVQPKTQKPLTQVTDNALITALTNPFVPTQVIKNQKTSLPKSTAFSSENPNKKISVSALKSTSENKNQGAENKSTEPSASTEQKRVIKKSRIAANFCGKS